MEGILSECINCSKICHGTRERKSVNVILKYSCPKVTVAEGLRELESCRVTPLGKLKPVERSLCNECYGYLADAVHAKQHLTEALKQLMIKRSQTSYIRRKKTLITVTGLTSPKLSKSSVTEDVGPAIETKRAYSASSQPQDISMVTPSKSFRKRPATPRSTTKPRKRLKEVGSPFKAKLTPYMSRKSLTVFSRQKSPQSPTTTCGTKVTLVDFNIFLIIYKLVTATRISHD